MGILELFVQFFHAEGGSFFLCCCVDCELQFVMVAATDIKSFQKLPENFNTYVTLN